MGIWGDILGGLETAGGVIGAPFTGGASLALVPAGLSTLAGSLNGGSSGSNTAGNLSSVLGGAAGGLANQQSQQAALAGAKVGAQQDQYQNALNQALLKGLTLPQQGAQMAAKGDVQANLQDMTPNFTPGMGYSFSGGLRPSDLGPNARQAGQNPSNAGLAAQSMSLPNMPNLTAGFPSSTPGALQQALQYGSLGSGIVSALTGGNQTPMQQLLAFLQKQGAQQNQNPNPDVPYNAAQGPQDTTFDPSDTSTW